MCDEILPCRWVEGDLYVSLSISRDGVMHLLYAGVDWGGSAARVEVLIDSSQVCH